MRSSSDPSPHSRWLARFQTFSVWLAFAIPLLVMAGCSAGPPSGPRTSEAPVEKWLGSLQTGDIAGVLQGITQSSRENWNQETLPDALAKRRQLMGGAAERFRIQSISENEKESRVHVIWTRQGGGHGARYRESFVLLHENGEWKVHLGDNWYTP